MSHTETGKRGWVEDHSKAFLVYVVLRTCVDTQKNYPLHAWLYDFDAYEVYNEDKDLRDIKVVTEIIKQNSLAQIGHIN